MKDFLIDLLTAWRIFRILRGQPNGAVVDIRPRRDEQ